MSGAPPAADLDQGRDERLTARARGSGAARAIIIPAIAADGTLYPIEKLAAHQAGVLHLAVSVFVFSGARLLIQRRAAHKYHCGGAWANTCCTHPHWNEPLAESAARRLREEMGVDLPLRPTAVIDYAADVTNGLKEVERVHVFSARADERTLSVRPDPAEVGETRWVAVEALKAEALEAPDRFAPWFRIYLKRWDELGLD
jgi:isopentenyl-diphosphate delta-isomerase